MASRDHLAWPHVPAPERLAVRRARATAAQGHASAGSTSLASLLFSCLAAGRQTRSAPCDAVRTCDRGRGLASTRAEVLDLGGTVRRAGRFDGRSCETHCRLANGHQKRNSIPEFLECNDRRDRGTLNGDVMRKSIWGVLAVAIRVGRGNAVLAPAGSAMRPLPWDTRKTDTKRARPVASWASVRIASSRFVVTSPDGSEQAGLSPVNAAGAPRRACRTRFRSRAKSIGGATVGLQPGRAAGWNGSGNFFDALAMTWRLRVMASVSGRSIRSPCSTGMIGGAATAPDTGKCELTCVGSGMPGAGLADFPSSLSPGPWRSSSTCPQTRGRP